MKMTVKEKIRLPNADLTDRAGLLTFLICFIYFLGLTRSDGRWWSFFFFVCFSPLWPESFPLFSALTELLVIICKKNLPSRFGSRRSNWRRSLWWVLVHPWRRSARGANPAERFSSFSLFGPRQAWPLLLPFSSLSVKDWPQAITFPFLHGTFLLFSW